MVHPERRTKLIKTDRLTNPSAAKPLTIHKAASEQSYKIRGWAPDLGFVLLMANQLTLKTAISLALHCVEPVPCPKMQQPVFPRSQPCSENWTDPKLFAIEITKIDAASAQFKSRPNFLVT